MGMEQPEEMTGRSLLVKQREANLLLGGKAKYSPKGKREYSEEFTTLDRGNSSIQGLFWLFVKDWGKMLLFCVTVNVDKKTQQAACGPAALIFLKCC